MASESERDLQRHYKSCDLDALAQLLEIYDTQLQARALRRAGGNREIADEAMGELRLKLSKAQTKRSYDAERPWYAWAGKVLDRIVIDLLRKEIRKRKREGPLPQTPNGQIDPLPDPTQTSPIEDVVEEEDQGELTAAIVRCLDRLDEKEFTVVVLRVWLGWTFLRIAEHLCGEGSPAHDASNVYYNAARPKLKACLEEHADSGGGHER